MQKTLVAIASLLHGAALAVAATPDVRIEHVTIVSPERPRPVPDVEVVIRDGRIASISRADAASASGAEQSSSAISIDGRGLYLTPGLIDSHVHLGSIPGMTDEQEARHPEIALEARQQLPKSYLLHGFTTLIDLISDPQQMARWMSHEPVPDTYFCGGAALIDGYPMNFIPKPQRYQAMPYLLIEPGTAAPPGIDAALHTPAAVVARMKADGAICVKTFFEHGFGPTHDLPVPKVETIQALVKAAHAAGMPVLLHANGVDGHSFGLEAGVDIMAHGIWHWKESTPTNEPTPAIRKILDSERARNVGFQPTIQVLYGERDLFDPTYLSNPAIARVLPASLIDWYRTTEGQWFHDLLAEGYDELKGKDPQAAQAIIERDYALPIERDEHVTGYFAARGGRLLFGTDTPSAPTYANPPGLNGWLEMQRLIAAGETPAQILRSATIANAEALKLDREVGTVQVGKRANLLLLRRDPTQTIQAYADIAKVILRGRVLDPAELVAH